MYQKKAASVFVSNMTYDLSNDTSIDCTLCATPEVKVPVYTRLINEHLLTWLFHEDKVTALYTGIFVSDGEEQRTKTIHTPDYIPHTIQFVLPITYQIEHKDKLTDGCAVLS